MSRITNQDKLWLITVRRDDGDQWPPIAATARITVYPDELLIELDDGSEAGPYLADKVRSVTVTGPWRNQNGPLRSDRRRVWLNTARALNQLGGAFLNGLVMAAYDDLHARHEARRRVREQSDVPS